MSGDVVFIDQFDKVLLGVVCQGRFVKMWVLV